MSCRVTFKVTLLRRVVDPSGIISQVPPLPTFDRIADGIFFHRSRGRQTRVPPSAEIVKPGTHYYYKKEKKVYIPTLPSLLYVRLPERNIHRKVSLYIYEQQEIAFCWKLSRTNEYRAVLSFFFFFWGGLNHNELI